MSALIESTLMDHGYAGWIGLPESLSTALAGLSAVPTRADLGEGLANLQEALELILVRGSARQPFHDLLHHTHVVVALRDALVGYTELTRRELPTGLVHGGLLGAAGHDWGHPGAMFFTDVPPALRPFDYRRSDGSIRPVELWSAGRLDLLLEALAIPLAQRQVAAYTVLCTASGAVTEIGRWLGVDRVQPSGLIGRAIRAADVAVAGDWATAVHREGALAFGERTPFPVPETVDQWLDARRRFLRYVEALYTALDRAAGGAPLTEHIGWRRRLADDRRLLAAAPGDPVLLSILRANAERQGHPLR